MKRIIIHTQTADQKGIISKYTQDLSSIDINILKLEQHVEPDDPFQIFFMRIEAEILNEKISYELIEKTLEETDLKFNAKSRIFNPEEKRNMAILVTKESLPLYDILIKNQTNEINSNIKVIVSNHDTLKNIANQFNIDFCHIDTAKDKIKANEELTKVLEEHNINLVILARYMQIIPNNLVKSFKGKMINIHHAFLPAFKGGHAYHKAWKRGVKIIGATAHYVTNELDEGPIISQDVVSVNHHHSIPELINSGRNLERNVLVDAIKAHLENRVMIHGKRTIVFSK